MTIPQNDTPCKSSRLSKQKRVKTFKPINFCAPFKTFKDRAVQMVQAVQPLRFVQVVTRLSLSLVQRFRRSTTDWGGMTAVDSEIETGAKL
jgi:hypothetical protein